MTNPTVEEAHVITRKDPWEAHPCCADLILAIKRQRDEAQAAIADLTEASQAERAAALVTIEELTEERDGAEATERDAWKQVEEQERTIDYLERRIEGLEKALYPFVNAAGWQVRPREWSAWTDRARKALAIASSEPETG
jgi:hypothetical protein